MSQDNELISKINDLRKAVRESHNQYHFYNSAGDFREAAKRSREISNSQMRISFLKKELAHQIPDAPEDTL